METLQTTIETELQSKENNAIVLWAMDYKEAHDEMGFEVTVPQLIEMLISFKKEFTDKDWYNAGIMAQRILQNDEIETLKKKLKQEEFNHTNTRISWDETSSERDELKIKNKALEERIVQLMSQKEIDKKNLEADRRTIAHAAWTAAANAFRMYPDNKHTFSNYWETAK